MDSLNPKTVSIGLKRDSGIFNSWLSIVPTNSMSIEDIELITSQEDQEHLQKLSNPEKKKEFLAGRRAVFNALAVSQGTENFRLNLKRGVFGHPLLSGDFSGVFEVSIAHTPGLAAALLFPYGQQLAVDLELIRLDKDSRLRAIRSVLTSGELQSLGEGPDSTAIPLYILWTQKEALSKALKCGLTVPFSLLETTNGIYKSDWTEVYYKNFYQYRCVSFLVNRFYAISIVLPRKTQITNLEEIIFKLNQN